MPYQDAEPAILTFGSTICVYLRVLQSSMFNFVAICVSSECMTNSSQCKCSTAVA